MPSLCETLSSVWQAPRLGDYLRHPAGRRPDDAIRISSSVRRLRRADPGHQRRFLRDGWRRSPQQRDDLQPVDRSRPVRHDANPLRQSGGGRLDPRDRPRSPSCTPSEIAATVPPGATTGTVHVPIPDGTLSSKCPSGSRMSHSQALPKRNSRSPADPDFLPEPIHETSRHLRPSPPLSPPRRRPPAC